MENRENEELVQEQLPEMQRYTIEATEVDIKTMSTLFGGEIYDRLKAEDQFTQIDATIETLFATSHMLFRLAVLNKEALNANDQIAKTFNKLALVFAKVGKDLLDKNDEVFEEGLFNNLTKDDLDPIMEVLNNIDVDLPEGLL